MRVKLSKNAHNQIYVSKDVREVLKLPNEDTEVQGIADTRTILLLQTGMTADEALRSLKVIEQHLKLEAEEERKMKEEVLV